MKTLLALFAAALLAAGSALAAPPLAPTSPGTQWGAGTADLLATLSTATSWALLGPLPALAPLAPAVVAKPAPARATAATASRAAVKPRPATIRVVPSTSTSSSGSSSSVIQITGSQLTPTPSVPAVAPAPVAAPPVVSAPPGRGAIMPGPMPLPVPLTPKPLVSQF